ncbi:lipopolysaccharide assembly protein LapA domain-containing protein [Corynebacterium sp. ES2794-CONJ1]|uniref:LapA family protein n=1 Tax=unclassified Corynebacterium TaxID=2624378 RepID=UPI002169ED2C|nr:MULTISPECIES: lipopolysaccharide assembly protein LapA domain-containing protein [unclassified Corynebacterium]MCS4489098.1 lipopolysaccharide assembly protein LapA domain-containing protein [Corynebacterium sp. ES2775-CONJ]MCS4490911.1 lipopolysaccharide assembly protein LapA domain-containing protein [Corynebacterium sp. ES2715-CONJ3]MCU9518575.1 lipopolysaccharide assembly protein LapA domain-containing protein [Corynebacterium sp. ES2794-CONJ1]
MNQLNPESHPLDADPVVVNPGDANPATSITPVVHEGAAVTPATAVNEDKASATSSTSEVKSSIAGGTWVALILGALLLIVLLVFILQNQQQIELVLFAWNFTFPAGVGFLLAAIAGALIMALVGGVRILQLRSQVKKAAHHI